MEYTKDQIELIESELNSVDTESLYNDMLDDCYGDVQIGECTYSTGYVLQLVDPTAYRCGTNDYIDSLCSDSVLVEINSLYYYYAEVVELLNRED